LLPEPAEFEQILEEETLTTAELIGSSLPEHQAELQWRLSTILLIPVITLIAVPLARVNPRQGRYNKLVPAFLIYAGYFLLLQYSRDLVAESNLSAFIGLWWVHALFISIGVVAYRFPQLAQIFSTRRAA